MNSAKPFWKSESDGHFMSVGKIKPVLILVTVKSHHIMNIFSIIGKTKYESGFLSLKENYVVTVTSRY